MWLCTQVVAEGERRKEGEAGGWVYARVKREKGRRGGEGDVQDEKRAVRSYSATAFARNAAACPFEPERWLPGKGCTSPFSSVGCMRMDVRAFADPSGKTNERKQKRKTSHSTPLKPIKKRAYTHLRIIRDRDRPYRLYP